MRLPVVHERACGECTVCCVMVGIPELDKPARARCRHLSPVGENVDGRCAIYASPERPPVCGKFLCSWMRGHGRDEDRPDRCGVLISVNALEGASFALAIELEPDAVRGKGAAMVAAVATNTHLPAVISDYDSLPPTDKGDRVAVHTSILYRARGMVGEFLGWIGPEVALHKLQFSARGS